MNSQRCMHKNTCMYTVLVCASKIQALSNKYMFKKRIDRYLESVEPHIVIHTEE